MPTILGFKSRVVFLRTLRKAQTIEQADGFFWQQYKNYQKKKNQKRLNAMAETAFSIL